MSDDTSFLVVIGWIVWTVINAMIASAKNRSVGLVILSSVLLSPIAGYLYILAVPALPAEKTEEIE